MVPQPLEVKEQLKAQRNLFVSRDLGLPTFGPHDGAELLSECGSFSVISTLPLEVTLTSPNPPMASYDELAHLGWLKAH